MGDALVEFTVVAPSCEFDELSEFRLRLGSELRDAGWNSEPVVDPAGPNPGTKAGESIALGSLVVSIAPHVLPKLLETVTHWLRRQPAQAERLIVKTADAEIDIPRDVTPEQLREYVDALSDRSD